MAGLNEGEILKWIKSSVRYRSNIFRRGYQGYTYRYEGNDKRLIIKATMGWGFGKLVRRWMLRNEYRVYTRLSGLNGIPACYGFFERRYLILEFIDGTPMRSAQIENRDLFFETLLNLIKGMHDLGVAHTDLKKKDNILVVNGQHPYVIDFGAAIVRKSGFAPLNHYLYKLSKKFDYNAWAKLKYNRKLENISEEDRQYYNRTIVEQVSHWIKRVYRSVKRRLLGST
jgi:predicted Ser/Thr protein kinase